MCEIENNYEISHQYAIPYHHFAEAPSECLKVYKHGYFISTVMISQAVAEGILRFVLECNGIPPHEKNKEVLKDLKILVKNNIITQECCEAFSCIRGGFRNDVHHMNSSVVKVPFKELAKSNIHHLATIESEIFGYSVSRKGKIIPKQPKYWGIVPGRDTRIFIRGIL